MERCGQNGWVPSGPAVAAMLEIYLYACDCSLSELARNLDLPKSTLSRWLSDQCVASLPWRMKMTARLIRIFGSLFIFSLPFWVQRGDRQAIIRSYGHSYREHMHSVRGIEPPKSPRHEERISLADILRPLYEENSEPRPFHGGGSQGGG